jgi:IS30 family transposase
MILPNPTQYFVLRSSASNNGAKFAEYQQIEKLTGAIFYFANPYSW